MGLFSSKAAKGGNAKANADYRRADKAYRRAMRRGDDGEVHRQLDRLGRAASRGGAAAGWDRRG